MKTDFLKNVYNYYDTEFKRWRCRRDDLLKIGEFAHYINNWYIAESLYYHPYAYKELFCLRRYKGLDIIDPYKIYKVTKIIFYKSVDPYYKVKGYELTNIYNKEEKIYSPFNKTIPVQFFIKLKII